jgi:hypothetical protein
MKKEEKDMVTKMVFGLLAVIVIVAGVYYVPDYFYAPAPNSEEEAVIAVGETEEYYSFIENVFAEKENEIINGAVVFGEKPTDFNILVLTVDGKVHNFYGDNLRKDNFEFETIDSLEHIIHMQPDEDNVYFLGSDDYTEFIKKSDLLVGSYNIQKSESKLQEEFVEEFHLYYDGITKMVFE